MKGILLAGGTGSRLHPLTSVVSKQLLPVYDKPLIHYPLSTLMLAGIRDILLISTQDDVPRFSDLLGDGSSFGISISYAVQNSPKGVADALLVAESYLGNDNVSLALGDNILYGAGLATRLRDAARINTGAMIFGYPVRDASAYGVAETDNAGRVISLEEKPENPKSSLAVVGLYFYDSMAVEYAKNIRPSARGELEITDLNRRYLELDQLHLERFGRGTAWLDTGTPESLMAASAFVHAIEQRQGMKICCPEEIAFRSGFIDADSLERSIYKYNGSGYGKYLRQILNESKSFSSVAEGSI